MREKANAKFEEPLTLEQLLEMNGKPVWTELLVESTGRKEGWTLIYNDDGYAAVQRWTQSPLWYKDYGKTWLAYAYHPVHIDREKWEPCHSCDSKCLICMINETDKCRRCKYYKYYLPLYQFCPKCGRPITDEAWDELEKRLGGGDGVKCKFEHQGDCFNCGSSQYMYRCKPDVCQSAVPMTNADRIRAMSDEDMATELINTIFDLCEDGVPREDYVLNWLRQPVEED